MRALAFVFVMVVPMVAEAQNNPAQLLTVKEWNGTLTRKVKLMSRADGCVMELDSTETYKDLKLVVEDSGDDFKCWKSKGKARLEYHAKNEVIGEGTSTREETSASGEKPGEVRLCVYAADNKFRLTPSMEAVPGTYTSRGTFPGQPTQNKSEKREVSPPGGGKAEGALPSTPSINGHHNETIQWGGPCGMAPLAVDLTWDLTGDAVPSKVFIDPPPENWTPTINGKTEVRIHWNDQSATEIEATLDPSHEPGRYMNDTQGDVDFDLQIPKGVGKWRVIPEGRKEIRTFKAILSDVDPSAREVKLPIEALDYGAYGKVKARVKIAGRWIDAKTVPGKPFARVPFDDDEDNIADSWEKEKGTLAHGPTWDEDPEPQGPQTKGDTLSHYEEYRGFWGIDGGQGGAWRRLDPKLRQHFVQDLGRIVKPDLVKQASGIEVVLVDNAHQKGRVVNFRRGYGHVHDKYSVVVEKVTSVKKNGFRLDTSVNALTVGATYPSGATSPRRVQWVAIFTAHLNLGLKQSLAAINRAIKNPGTIPGLEKIPIADLEKIRDRMRDDPTFVQQVLDQQINLTVLHELGHSMAMPHHQPDDKGGAKSCPIRYETDEEAAQILLTATAGAGGPLPGGVGRFCSGGADDSMGKINLQD
jgi:hypothetical protein